jgi:hypothetical protein
VNHSATESSAGGIAGGEGGQRDKGYPGSCHGGAFVSPSAAESSVVNPPQPTCKTKQKRVPN